jgi:hypothetical protein
MKETARSINLRILQTPVVFALVFAALGVEVIHEVGGSSRS